MGSFSIWHIVLVGLVVVLLFGRGKLSDFMGDAAKGIKAFKKGLADDEPAADKSRIIHEAEVVHAPPGGGSRPVNQEEKVPH